MSLSLDRSAWKRVSLAEVARHVTDRVDPEASGLERFLAGEHIPSGSLAITDWGVIGRDPIGPMFYKRFKPGHVLYVSRRTYLRKVAVPDFVGVTGEKTFVLESLDPAVLLQGFLPFILSAETFHRYAIANSRGSVNPYLNWGELAAYEFELPPLDEQQRIADLLWAVERDRLAQATRLVAGERLLDRWMLEAVDGPGEQVPLRKLIANSIGGVWGSEPGASERDVRVIRGTDIDTWGVIRLDGAPQRSISQKEAASRLLGAGDVLVEKSGGSPDQPVGKVGLVRVAEADAVPSNFVLRLRPDIGVCQSEYLYILLRGMWRHGRFAEFTGKTTNIANLRTKELLSSTVRLPDRSRQARVRDELGRLEALHAKLQASTDASRDLLNALLADIFGGA